MKTIHDDDRFSVIYGEALMTMRHLPSKMVDMVLTDPPYGEHTHSNLGKERRMDGYYPRSLLQFPPIDHGQIVSLAAEFVRLTKGWILICSDYYHSAMWGEAIREAGGAWVRTGHWVKTSPMPQFTGDRPAVGAEDIVIGHASNQSKDWEWNAHGHAAIWRGGRDKPNLHPNQKPVWLMQTLLGQFAPAGGLVLDAFFGTGSTAVAAFHPDRVIGEVDVETTCVPCGRKRAEAYAPPLPVDLRVIGIEGNSDIAAAAVKRVTNGRR